MQWLEGLALARESLAAVGAAASCRPEHQGLLIAIILVLLAALFVCVPLACCCGCGLGAGSAALLLSRGLRQAIFSAATAVSGVHVAPAAPPRAAPRAAVGHPPLAAYLHPHAA